MPRVGASRVRNLVVPCVLTPQLPPCAIPHLNPDPLSTLSLLACHPLLTRLSSSPYSLSFTLPLHFPSLCRFHTRPIKFSIHVFFHGVRETGLFTHGRASRNFTIIPMCTPGVAVPCHAVPGSDVPCPTPSPRCPAPAPGFHFLKFLTIISISPIVSSKSTFPSENFSYL